MRAWAASADDMCAAEAQRLDDDGRDSWRRPHKTLEPVSVACPPTLLFAFRHSLLKPCKNLAPCVPTAS